MTNEEIRKEVIAALLQIAPEFEGEELDEMASIRDEYDIDSVDHLNFIIRLHETLNIDIPETDYPKLDTIANCVDYLSQK